MTLKRCALSFLISLMLDYSFGFVPRANPFLAIFRTSALKCKGTERFHNQAFGTVSDGVKLLTVLSEQSIPNAESTERWIQPAFHNKNSVRVAILLLTVGILGKGSLYIGKTLSSFLHIVSFASAFGSNFYTTFFLGITMFRNLPRQTFGKLQAKLFPVYFLLQSGGLILSIMTKMSAAASSAATRMLLPLYFSLFANLLNQFIFNPMSTEIMIRRYDLENVGDTKSDEYLNLAARFGKFHGICSLLNLATLVGLLAYAWQIAKSVA